MASIGIGIVGYGKVASRQHSEWIAARSDAALVAVCDTTEVRRAAAAADHPEAVVYGELDELLADDAVALVIVTTPPSSHCEIAIAASAAGKHLFVDKPFAMTREEAARMLDAGAAAGVTVHCNQSRRYDGEYQTIVRAVRAGRIGEVVHVRRVWAQTGEEWSHWGIDGFLPTWRIQRAFGGGMIYDYVPHCGDQVLRLIDRPLTSLWADARAVRFSTEVDDHVSCLARFSGGATAYLEMTNLGYLPAPHWYVAGTHGALSAERVGSDVMLHVDGAAQPEVLPPHPDRQPLYDNLLACCRGRAEPVVTRDQLLQTMGLIDAIKTSAASGREVQLSA